MSKKITVSQLKPGMYITDVGSDWMTHPFFRQQFQVKDEHVIERLVKAGIHEVYIDPNRGLDVADAPSAQEVQQSLETELVRLVSGSSGHMPAVALKEAAADAQRVYEEATRIIRGVMHDVRLGRQVQGADVEPAVQDITSTIIQNRDALLSLCRVKTKDNYTFQHSVSVGALEVTFCRALGLDVETTRLAGIGGLLHDIGKICVPDEILNKPARLTEDEFQTMKRHVIEGKRVLEEADQIDPLSIQIAYEHHERTDGSGYPEGRRGSEISLLGRMAAICDVYDALTSERVYHRPMLPHEALRKIYEWSKFHFDPQLVHQFVRIIGIYPVGTLVLLRSGRIGVVVEQSEQSLLTPRVRVFYHSVQQAAIPPMDIDLSRPMGHGGADEIVAPADPDAWGLDWTKSLGLTFWAR